MTKTKFENTKTTIKKWLTDKDDSVTNQEKDKAKEKIKENHLYARMLPEEVASKKLIALKRKPIHNEIMR